MNLYIPFELKMNPKEQLNSDTKSWTPSITCGKKL
ncbi:hypothetical protein NC651_021823 [Populus alba x Populus x berolinensis]|nr:hypothetical protein NC651_021823 [Populus alba x Populus x berolinensis]